MDKLKIKFPLSKNVIEKNIRNVIENKPLTIPLALLRKNPRFMEGIKINIQKKRYCLVCNKEIKENRRSYCSDKCQNIIITESITIDAGGGVFEISSRQKG